MAVSAMALGYLTRVIFGSTSDVGPFALVASIAPLGLMIVVSWIFRLFSQPNNDGRRSVWKYGRLLIRRPFRNLIESWFR